MVHIVRNLFNILGSAWHHGRMPTTTIGTVRRWSMLVIALTATTCANVFINGAAFLIPTLHAERGLDLARRAPLLAEDPAGDGLGDLDAAGDHDATSNFHLSPRRGCTLCAVS